MAVTLIDVMLVAIRDQGADAYASVWCGALIGRVAMVSGAFTACLTITPERAGLAGDRRLSG